MKKKSKGMTLIELIIALALTVVILGIAYTFFLTSNKNFTLVDIQTDLQTEGKNIEEKILKIGTEAKEISSIKDIAGNDLINGSINDMGLNNDVLTVKSLSFNPYQGPATTIVINGKKLEVGGSIISNNVESIEIKPLNINQITDRTKTQVKDLSGYEITIKLKLKKGTVEATHSVSVKVKFRNKEDLQAQSIKEAKDVETIITNNGTQCKGLSVIKINNSDVNVINEPLKTIGLEGDLALDVKSIEFEKYDNTKVTFLFKDNTLTMMTVIDGETTTISEYVKEFKIRTINRDEIIDDKTKLNDLPGFELFGEVELKVGSTLVTHPINIIIKFM